MEKEKIDRRVGKEPKNKIRLSEKDLRYLVRHYKHTANADLAARYGVSTFTISRWAKQYSLKKSKQFMKAAQLNAADRAKESHIRNGTYPPKGYIIPGSEKNRFRKGETCEMRIGHERELRRREKMSRTRKDLIYREKIREKYGLPLKTKLRVVRQPSGLVKMRFYLKKIGYEVNDAQKVAYWSDETRRATRLEKNGCKWYTFVGKNKINI